MVETSKHDVKRPETLHDDVKRQTDTGPSKKVEQLADRSAHKAAKDEQEYDSRNGEFTK